MEYILDWLNLLFRWLHIITGAAWIGTSFYFNWLNHSIRDPEEPMDGIKGQLFSVHGGHFYQVLKYEGAPAKLPKTLHWFKWEAYFTWITGFCLLTIIYYCNSSMLIDVTDSSVTHMQAVMISLGVIVGSWLVYDLMCKSPLRKQPVIFAVLGFILFTAAAYGLTTIYGSRAAYMHIGVMIGTMMAANVFFVIIPNQRIMVDAMQKGETPDTTLGDAGAFRSLHNNYFTLPLLFIMVSNHYAMTYGHAMNWAILAALSLIGAGARHYFNLMHKGKNKVWILPVAALSMVALAWVIRPEQTATVTVSTEEQMPYEIAEVILQKRCQTCHSAKPTFPGMTAPPKGVVYDSPKMIQSVASKIKAQAIDSNIMPPGNITKITEAERQILKLWIEQGANIPPQPE